MSYYVNIRCKNCNRLAENSGHGVDVYNSIHKLRFCNECGEYAGWKDSIEEWTSTAVWWKPWTWHNGYWTEK